MSIGTLLGIAVSASVLAHSAAVNRGRNATGWGILAFLFPIVLLVLWSLGPRPAAGAAQAAKTPTTPAPTGWADGHATSAEQHVATSDRGASASLAESW